MESSVQALTDKEKSLRKTLLLCYALYGLFFFTGIAGVVAVIIDYVKRSDARGTWLEGHFAWQIKTFWIFLGLFFLTALITKYLTEWLGWIVGAAVLAWYFYRLYKGVMALIGHRAVV